VSFHPKAWLAWAIAAGALTLAINDPFTSLSSLAALSIVAVAFARRAPEGRSFAVFLKVGIAFLLVRVLLFSLTGHTGNVTLFTLPSVGLPRGLGGFSIGGAVTGEVVAQSIAEGLKIAAFLATFGVFLSVVEPSRLLRSMPRRLQSAGLVVGIALTFVPTMLRTASDVRDAQRLRGHRSGGMRALRPLVVPVVAGALERSLALAASMESRGYGGERPRTRMRAEPVGAHDIALMVVSSLVVASAFVLRSAPAASWYPYPVLAWPVLDARLVGASASLIAPVVIGALRVRRLRRASATAPSAIEVVA